jgi:hypothetical protein
MVALIITLSRVDTAWTVHADAVLKDTKICLVESHSTGLLGAIVRLARSNEARTCGVGGSKLSFHDRSDRKASGRLIGTEYIGTPYPYSQAFQGWPRIV